MSLALELHGFDFELAETAALEGSVGKAWGWGEPAEWTCPRCGITTQHQRTAYMKDGQPWGGHWSDYVDVVARAWILAGFDGVSGCLGTPQNMPTVTIVERCRQLLTEGFGR